MGTPRSSVTSVDQRPTAGRLAGRLESRWLAETQVQHNKLDSLLRRHAALLAAVHSSRRLAATTLDAWCALHQASRWRAAAAAALHRRVCLARSLQAWAHCRAWGAVAAEACAAADARRQRQMWLQRQGLAALARHARWACSLVRRHHAAHMSAMALHHWRLQAAASRLENKAQLEAAVRHRDRLSCRRALQAWQLGVQRCRQERVVQQRREARWQSVQQYLADHRREREAAAAAAAAAATATAGQQQLGCDAACGGHAALELSSAENSVDPNRWHGCK